MDRRLAQNCFNLSLKTFLEASPGSICLFLPLTPGSLTELMLAQAQNHRSITK